LEVLKPLMPSTGLTKTWLRENWLKMWMVCFEVMLEHVIKQIDL